MWCGGLQIRGAEPSVGAAANPGKIGEGIANNINGPDAKGAASEVCTCCCWCSLCCCKMSLCTFFHLSTGSRLLCWLSCNSSALLCHHACPKIDSKCTLLVVVVVANGCANVCLILSLLLPPCDNLGTKGAPICFLLIWKLWPQSLLCGLHQ